MFKKIKKCKFDSTSYSDKTLDLCQKCAFEMTNKKASNDFLEDNG